MKSILDTIKQMLGVEITSTAFDTDIIVHINSVLITLNQLGIGTENFFITGNSETWDDFLNNTAGLEIIKSYVYLKVKILFDPSTNSSVNDAITRQISELEWRLNIKAESTLTF
jgi:hypothetical protein